MISKNPDGTTGSADLGASQSWFTEPGPDYDVVVSTRVRLARNLAGFSFPGFMDPEEEQTVVTGIAQVFQDKFSSREYLFVDPARLHPWSRLLLLERNLVADTFDDKTRAMLILRSDEHFSASVNLVDHLRLSVLRGGNQVRSAYREVDHIDRIVEDVLPYAVSLEWGYLNSEITNIGTGMRASVLLHLPALMETDRAPEVFETIARAGFMVKGFWIADDNTEVRRSLGDMYQVSNFVTIGVREVDIVEKLAKATEQLVHYEQKARRELTRGSKQRAVEDRIQRSRNLLQCAPSLGYREAVESLSDMRLGIALGTISDVRMETVTSLLFISQRSHVVHALHEADEAPGDLQESGEGAIDSAVINVQRAALVRGYLGPADEPDPQADN